MRRHKNKQRKIIVLSLVCFLFIMSVGYAAFQTNLTIHAKGTLKEPSRIIQSWNESSSGDFHSAYYKQNIVSATFLDNRNIPNNAVESWDISADGKGGVKAWVVQNNSNNTKFDLYIGADGGVIANEESGYLFYEFPSVASINFNNNFDTSEATDMTNMFRKCSSLTTLDLSSFDTSKVTGMARFVSECTNLTSIDVSSFNTMNVDNMLDMFSYTKIVNLNLDHFFTPKITSIQGMFFDCQYLESVSLANLTTSNVKFMYGVFYNCKKLKTLNLCSLDTRQARDMNDFFGNTYSLTQVKVGPNWSTENATTVGMFSNSNISSVTTGQC